MLLYFSAREMRSLSVEFCRASPIVGGPADIFCHASLDLDSGHGQRGKLFDRLQRRWQEQEEWKVERWRKIDPLLEFEISPKAVAIKMVDSWKLAVWKMFGLQNGGEVAIGWKTSESNVYLLLKERL